MRDYRATVRSANTAIPAAVEIETLFGSADHFITHYGIMSQKTIIWNTEVFFGGRYTLTMQVKTQIDYHTNTLRAVSAPIFYLKETVRVDNLDGQIHSKIGANFVFSIEEWKLVYENRGDFTVIGLNLNKDPVPGFDELIKAMRAPRIPVISLVNPK